MAEAVSIPPASRPPIHFAPGQNIYAQPSVVDPSRSHPTYPQNHTLHQTNLEETVGLSHGSKTIHPTQTTLNPSPTDTSHIYDETVLLLEARKELRDFVHLVLKGDINLSDGALGVSEHTFKVLVDSGEGSSLLAEGTTDLWSIQVSGGGLEERRTSGQGPGSEC
ncbi:hypothetical protein N7537_008285 [Penicillium hordei]|uniref:Uncharacterized protein n=1 Tax=Penicillium hordei TaxID=40994 RepID=A0AAD6E1A9_9EURO|nr:uncharacterized protein N7537_008285 [Penicillium hordei]KAJ5598201.1 hypothetical protein N7537_008285 [Penicillium hordei]